MSTPLSASATLQTGSGATARNEISRMQSQREQLTSHLRTLATELDGLDRRLSDLDWRGHHQTPSAAGDEMSGERTAWETQRGHLTTHLRDLARQLNDLDVALASWKGHPPIHAPRVGTCPDCGYPSLDSGLCAFCRPRLAH